MSDLTTLLKNIAPTLASAILGPAATPAIVLLSNILGVEPSKKSLDDTVKSGNLTSEHLLEIKKLELQYQNDEKTLGFQYADLEFKDRDSARKANVAGGMQEHLFWLSILLLVIALGTEVFVLFNGYPTTLPDVIVGRVLGLLDSIALMVLAYWFGSSSGSKNKTELLAKADSIKD